MNNKLLNLITFVFLSIAAFFFIKIIQTYAINIPLWDDYNSGLTFLNSFVLAKNFNEKILILVSQHNEHRILVTKLFELLDYYIFGQINFLHLIYLGDFILIMCVIPMLLITKTVEFKYKTNFAFLTMCALILLMQPSQWESIIWVGSSIQQYSQILISLWCIYFIVRYVKEPHSNYLIWFIVLNLINSFTGGGWVILLIAVNLFLLIRKKWQLFSYCVFLSFAIAYINFILLPYNFLPHQHTDIVKLFIFIVGFTGSTFFTNTYSLMVGAAILFLIIINLKKIYKNDALLLWFIFFFCNALIIGFARSGMGSNGLDSRYAIYSLINLFFCMTLVYTRWNKLVYYYLTIFFIGFSGSYYQWRHIPGALKVRHDIAMQYMYYPSFMTAAQNYYKSKELGVYSSKIIDNNIAQIQLYSKDYGYLEVKNNIKLNAKIGIFDEIGALHVAGWVIGKNDDQANFDKYIILKSKQNIYSFKLKPVCRDDVVKAYNLKGNPCNYGIDSFIFSSKLVKGDTYDVFIYMKSHDSLISGIKELNKNYVYQ